MADVDGPIERQRNLFEHRTIEPSIVRGSPEHRMRHRVSCFPVPVLITPENPRFITARGHELQILAVCHHVFVDFERWKLRGMRVELIVPSKTTAYEAQCRRAGRNLNHPM